MPKSLAALFDVMPGIESPVVHDLFEEETGGLAQAIFASPSSPQTQHKSDPGKNVDDQDDQVRLVDGIQLKKALKDRHVFRSI